jgi:hypothetical protein
MLVPPPLDVQPALAIAGRVMDRRRLPCKLSPVCDQRVVGGRFLGVLPLIGADIIEAIREVLYSFCLRFDFLKLDLSRIYAAPAARLGCLAFEGQGAFASQS